MPRHPRRPRRRSARRIGAINALARDASGRWTGDIFDGIGCVEAFRRRAIPFRGRRVALIGAGGAGTAIGIAIAHERPQVLHIRDPDPQRVAFLRQAIGMVDAAIDVREGIPEPAAIDVLLNASPVGMLDDQRVPIEADRLPSSLVVFDAIVKPETTRLLALAEASGCTMVRGREMMQGQIDRMIDFFGFASPDRVAHSMD